LRANGHENWGFETPVGRDHFPQPRPACLAPLKNSELQTTLVLWVPIYEKGSMEPLRNPLS
jgi:hypothetical protein